MEFGLAAAGAATATCAAAACCRARNREGDRHGQPAAGKEAGGASAAAGAQRSAAAAAGSRARRRQPTLPRATREELQLGAAELGAPPRERGEGADLLLAQGQERSRQLDADLVFLAAEEQALLGRIAAEGTTRAVANLIQARRLRQLRLQQADAALGLLAVDEQVQLRRIAEEEAALGQRAADLDAQLLRRAAARGRESLQGLKQRLAAAECAAMQQRLVAFEAQERHGREHIEALAAAAQPALELAADLLRQLSQLRADAAAVSAELQIEKEARQSDQAEHGREMAAAADRHRRDMRLQRAGFQVSAARVAHSAVQLDPAAPPLGAGSFGSVRAASYHGGRVAVKLPASPSAASRARAKREMKVVVKLCHPNIVQTFGWYETEGGIAIIMEYCVTDLSQHSMAWVSRAGASWGVKLLWAAQLARALQHTHSKEIAHRDVKPANVLVASRDGPKATLKLADYGLAAPIDVGSAAQDQGGSHEEDRPVQLFTAYATGTAPFVPPEGWHPSDMAGSVCAAGDIYATGITVIECISGCRPFSGIGADDHQFWASVHNGDSRAVCPAVVGGTPVPEDLVFIVESCICGTPRDRPSAAELAETLELVAAEAWAQSQAPVRKDGDEEPSVDVRIDDGADEEEEEEEEEQEDAYEEDTEDSRDEYDNEPADRDDRVPQVV
eukprot:TRINITY_DN39748_c0_g1_i1.p1 TRINITY_DN39748_c0_g1~~TRINITY_DN39748_c0_g1_i1.p1  ORF type:complete len:674 (+),score=171.67 TRINITY_DN39748_c0_g1_i1:73-2094(+)